MATVQSPEEQRVLLRNVDWATYERLLAEREKNPAPRFTYDKGRLEILSPLTLEHEECSDNVRFLVRLLAGEWGMDIRALGSMTLKREDIQGGVEPDGCFYIQSLKSVRGKRRIDPRMDPPPDLAIEIDITHPTLDKLPIYARFGVAEVWRYDGHRLDIYVLEGEQYSERAESAVLSGVTSSALDQLLTESQTLGSVEWERRVREWARELRNLSTK